MTKLLLVFNTDGSSVISAQEYDAEFEAGLISGNVKHKVLEYDNQNEYYWGNYDTGSIRSLNDYPIMEELALDELVNKTILNKYSIHKQLNIISECMEQAGIPLTEDFQAMRAFIKEKTTNHSSAIQTYKNNPDTYSFVPKPETPAED